MKKNIFLITFTVLSFALSTDAQNCCSPKSALGESNMNNAESKELTVSPTTMESEITEKFTVYGNCGMCKRTIENSLKDVKGVSKAIWNKETDEMSVTFNPEEITLDAIKQKIADVGYDSDSHRATLEVYNSLPGCCQYDRPTDKLK